MRTITSIALIVLLASCARGVPMQTTVPTQTGVVYDAASMRAAVYRALERNHFVPQNEEPGRIHAVLEHRAFAVALAVDYAPGGYTIHYVGSDGLGYDPETQTINKRYPRIVEKLRRTIARELERPARDADAVAERARQHELELARAQHPDTYVVGVAPVVAERPAPTTTVTINNNVAPTANAQVAVNGQAAAPQPVSSGQVIVVPATEAPATAVRSCEESVVAFGHGSAATVHCAGAEPHCADTLLAYGHPPAALVHCRGVRPECAVPHLQGGGTPAALVHCH